MIWPASARKALRSFKPRVRDILPVCQRIEVPNLRPTSRARKARRRYAGQLPAETTCKGATAPSRNSICRPSRVPQGGYRAAGLPGRSGGLEPPHLGKARLPLRPALPPPPRLEPDPPRVRRAAGNTRSSTFTGFFRQMVSSRSPNRACRHGSCGLTHSVEPSAYTMSA